MSNDKHDNRIANLRLATDRGEVSIEKLKDGVVQ